jgi:hypothetical protein
LQERTTNKAADDSEANKRIQEEIVQLTMLLHFLSEHISQVNRAWSNFSNPGGDVSYFSDLRDRVAQHALSKIEQSFEKVIELEHKLTRMESACENLRKIASTRPLIVSPSNFEPAFTPHEFDTYRFESGEQPEKRKAHGG